MGTNVNEARLGLLAGQRSYHQLRDYLIEMNAVDVARFIEDLPREEATIIFRTLPKKHAMDVFAELEAQSQQDLVQSITDKEITLLINELAVDDAVDMLEEMPATLVKRVLKNASVSTRALLNQFLRYPDNSVGSIMTAEFTDLRKSMSVSEAIERIRTVGEDRETIYNCYVVDKTRVLQGVVTVRDLLVADDKASIGSIMEANVFSATTLQDQETAVNLMTKYGFIALPVVDAENRLVGIITIDDAVDILQDETTEDFEKMAGIKPSEKPYLKTGVMLLARNRFFWLLILMLSGILSGVVLERYEEIVFVAAPLLVAYIPLLTDMAGDAGSQASTLVIRGMALDEIYPKNLGTILWKELATSIIMVIPLAVINFVRIVWGYPERVGVGLVISITIMFTVTMANLLGGVLPIAAKKLKWDPALMATPMITTIVDVLSLLVYSGVAILILNL